jgi:NADH-quinone oxidoreductase subunit H
LGEPSILWLFAKLAVLMIMFVWIRASFPRYRYDQIMRLGWKVFIPLTIAWIVVVGVMLMEPVNNWPVINIWFGKQGG